MSIFNKIQLRHMLLEDIPEVLMIENTRNDLPWPEDTFRGCIEAGFECVAVEKNRKLIAYAVTVFRDNQAHVLNICVLPEEQRKGYGSHIMKYLFTKARDNKARKIILKVRENNEASCNFYFQLGFRSVERLLNYYDSPQGKNTALVLELEVN